MCTGASGIARAQGYGNLLCSELLRREPQARLRVSFRNSRRLFGRRCKKNDFRARIKITEERMAEEMLKLYKTLTSEQQKEAYDFVSYLCAKNTSQNVSSENPVTSLFGSMSENDAAQLRGEKFKFHEAAF
ncbi:MAG: hypothetical protein NC176_09275 [Treponema brennaborense]|nr:hypothetical protein [Prevotella sp.]MCM1408650.1 hypothetical protein [Treponema brennaborense]